jgi:hypothetical protein
MWFIIKDGYGYLEIVSIYVQKKALCLKKNVFFVLSQIILTFSKIIEKATYIYNIK